MIAKSAYIHILRLEFSAYFFLCAFILSYESKIEEIGRYSDRFLINFTRFKLDLALF